MKSSNPSSKFTACPAFPSLCLLLLAVPYVLIREAGLRVVWFVCFGVRFAHESSAHEGYKSTDTTSISTDYRSKINDLVQLILV